MVSLCDTMGAWHFATRLLAGQDGSRISCEGVIFYRFWLWIDAGKGNRRSEPWKSEEGAGCQIMANHPCLPPAYRKGARKGEGEGVVLYGRVLDRVFDVKVFSQALAVIVQPCGLLADSVNGLLHLLGVLLHLEEGGDEILVV